jgi:hypothetical protein
MAVMKNNKLKPILVSLLLSAGASAPCNAGAGIFGSLMETISGVRYGIPVIKTGNGISGSGAPAAYGTIDGFGSIYVNGVRFDTSGASIFIGGDPATEDELGVGMMVLVVGSVNADGTTGTAKTVIYDNEVQGPISAIEANADGDAKRLTILGVNVIVERTGTVFAGVTFETLEVGDVVEVSGFPEGDNNLRATRLEKQADAYSLGDLVEVEGNVSGLTASEFMLGALLVDYSGADLSELGASGLVEGLRVEVYGTLSNDVLFASKVEPEDRGDPENEDGDGYSLQGAIQDFVDFGSFTVNGTPVDATTAELQPASLALANGVVVQVDGFFNGDTLVAEEVSARRGDIEVEAAVAALDEEGGAITLGLFGGEVTVAVDSQTQFEDDTRQAPVMNFSDLRIGDFLEVEAIERGDGLWAVRIDREDPGDEVIQAPLEGFESGMSLTLLGVTFSVEGAEFEDRSGADTSVEAFFSDLAVGDLLKVEDEDPTDGIADEVEFEDAGRPDGGYDFDDEEEDESEHNESEEDEAREESDSGEEDPEDEADDDDEEESDDDSEEEEESGDGG